MLEVVFPYRPQEDWWWSFYGEWGLHNVPFCVYVYI